MDKFVKENNIFLAVEKDDKVIKIPYELFENEFKNRQNKKNKEKLDLYITHYLQCNSLMNNISNYIFSDLNETQALNLKKEINELKNYKYIDFILSYLDINLDNIENRMMDILITLGINNEDIKIIKEEYIKEIINSSDEQLTDEYIESLSEEISNANIIRASNSSDVNVESNVLLVIVYNHSYMDKPIENSVFNIYVSKQPLKGIIETNQINMRWIKVISIEKDLSDYLMETVRIDLCMKLRPTIFSVKDINDNDKWVNAKQLKKHFNISDGVRSETLEKIYDCLGFGYEYVNGVLLFNKQLFKDAENIYVNQLGKKVKYK